MRKGRLSKIQLSKGVYLLPSLCTTASMFLGFFAMIRSINGDYYAASWAILAATLFDTIDGRVARMMKTQSDFGREYDSLVDLASFGLAPAILVYTWALSQFKTVGWFFAFLYFACAALRLARYNIQVGVIEKKHFNGLPTPAAAGLVATQVMLYQNLWGEGAVKSLWALVFVPMLAVLMVSHVPYHSFKELNLKRQNSFYLLLGAAVTVGVVAIKPDVMLFIVFGLYVLSGPFAWLITVRKGSMKNVKVTYRTKKLSVAEAVEEETREIH